MQSLRPFPLARLASDPSHLPPEQALRRVLGGRRPVLLDGASNADGLGRYSYAACDPTAHYVLPQVPDFARLQQPADQSAHFFSADARGVQGEQAGRVAGRGGGGEEHRADDEAVDDAPAEPVASPPSSREPGPV